MFENHFYNSSTRRMVSVFGSLFNKLEVIKTDAAGKVLQKIKVPLAYGPRQKFLTRAKDLGDTKIAIKLPRISFEITDMSYDGAARINKTKKFIKVDPNDKKNVKSLGSPAVYKVNFELNVMTKGQDEALQILEQILPIFQPDYTVTIKDIPEMDITSDVPIVLNSVTLNDEYEGDYLSRRTVVYTLNFETRIRYYRGIQDKSVINKTEVSYATKPVNGKLELQTVDGTTSPYTESIDFFKYVTDREVDLLTIEEWEYIKDGVAPVDLTLNNMLMANDTNGVPIYDIDSDGDIDNTDGALLEMVSTGQDMTGYDLDSVAKAQAMLELGRDYWFTKALYIRIE